MPDLNGQNGRIFAEVSPGADATSFRIDNTSAEYFNSFYYKGHKDTLRPVPAPRLSPPRMTLTDVLGDATTQAYQEARQITFHAVGDTGAAQQSHLLEEESVADMMAADVRAGGPGAPAFFFHLGDVIYYFGEAQYYYDQFYDPYRAYDRPIFAIPGNHDGITIGDPGPGVPATLEAFLRNFCAETPAHSPDAGGLMRSAMTQPGVYFTLDAPLVSIIGLYSNVLEGPGVISSQGGIYPSMNDDQLAFLTAELARLQPARAAGERAVIVAVHHPPVSADAGHGMWTGLGKDIDAAATAAGLWPDAVLSGHAHLYQRFSRKIDGITIPYIVSGSGGYNIKPGTPSTATAGTTIDDSTLALTPVIAYGYLTVTVDMTGASGQLAIAFHSPKLGRDYDRVVVDLQTRQLISG